MKSLWQRKSFLYRIKYCGVQEMWKKYKIGFDIGGLIIFLIIMMLNFLWFLVPSPNDILRVDSVTVVVDTIASICQVLMIISLCVFIDQDRRKLNFTPLIIGAIICCFAYFVSWIFYYIGITNAIIILGLTIPPCLVFLFFAMHRKNMIAVIPILGFTICHLIKVERESA